MNSRLRTIHIISAISHEITLKLTSFSLKITKNGENRHSRIWRFTQMVRNENTFTFKSCKFCPKFAHYRNTLFFQANQQFMEKYNCTLPWMNPSKLKLCPILDENRPEDFHELTKNWNLMLDRVKTCPIHSHCTRPIYRFPNLISPKNIV